jgi:hypothetical protein
LLTVSVTGIWYESLSRGLEGGREKAYEEKFKAQPGIHDERTSKVDQAWDIRDRKRQAGAQNCRSWR